MDYILEEEQKKIKENLAASFIRCRRMQNMTQNELAQRTGIARSNIARFESGEDITLSTFIKLMGGLDLTENLVNTIPDQSRRPSAFLYKEKKRQRAVPKKQRGKNNKKFKWGDEE